MRKLDKERINFSHYAESCFYYIDNPHDWDIDDQDSYSIKKPTKNTKKAKNHEKQRKN